MAKEILTDIATTMMDDITLYEQIFSHSVPHIYATAISTLILLLMILIYNWKMGLATIWVMPISLLIAYLAKKKQKIVK